MNRFIASAFIAVCALPAFAATTFDVHKATATLSGFVKDTSGALPVLVPYKLGTNEIINLARGRGLKEKVPKNEVLAGAGDFAMIFTGDPSAARRLIVWNTDGGGAPLVAIILADNASVLIAENHFSAKGGFKRVSFADGTVQAVGNATNGFSSGRLHFNTLFKRTIAPPGSARPATPSYTGLVFGRIGVTDGGVAKDFFINKGVVNIRGKRIGQFTE